MKKTPRTPQQLAKEHFDRKTYSFSLNRTQTETLKKIAETSKVPLSILVDEAISAYLIAIKER